MFAGKLDDCLSYLSTTQWHRVAALLFLGLLGVGYGVGFSVAMQEAKNAADDDRSRYLALFNEWQMIMTSVFTKATSLAQSLAAFVSTEALVPMNFSASSVDRMRIINPAAFSRTCHDMYLTVPGILALQLQPGGVIAQSYPNGSAPIGLDLMRNPVEVARYNQIIATGKPLTVGPAALVQGGIGLFIRHPVFVSANKTRDTFWGAGNVVIRIGDLLRALAIDDLPQNKSIDYVMWYTTFGVGVNATAEDPLRSPTIVAASTIGTGRNPFTVMSEGMRVRLPIAEPGKASFMAIYPFGGPRAANISLPVLLTILFIVLFGAFVVVALLYTALFLHFCYRHRHAPESDLQGSEHGQGQVFMAALTLRSAQPVVEAAPLESVRIFGEFFAHVRATAASHKCYPICEIGDRGIYVVAKDPLRLLQLAQECVATIAIAGTTRPTLIISTAAGGDTMTAAVGDRSTNAADTSTFLRRIRSNHSINAKNNKRGVKEPVQQQGSGKKMATASGSPMVMEMSKIKTVHSPNVNNGNNNAIGVNRLEGSSIMESPSAASNYDDDDCEKSVAGHSSHGGGKGFHGTDLIICSPSAACHAAVVPRCYDAQRDTYFYGSSAVLGKLGAAVDETIAGEVAWTSAFEEACCSIHGLNSASEGFFGAKQLDPVSPHLNDNEHNDLAIAAAADVSHEDSKFRDRKAVTITVGGGITDASTSTTTTLTFLIGPPNSTHTVLKKDNNGGAAEGGGGTALLFVASWGRPQNFFSSALAANPQNQNQFLLDYFLGDDDEGSVVSCSTTASSTVFAANTNTKSPLVSRALNKTTATTQHRVGGGGGGFDLASLSPSSRSLVIEIGGRKRAGGYAAVASKNKMSRFDKVTDKNGSNHGGHSDDDDDDKGDDPSTAMAILSDPYIKRMCVIASNELRARRRGGQGMKGGGKAGGLLSSGGGDHSFGDDSTLLEDGDEKGPSHEKGSAEATAIARTATLLHIAVTEGDPSQAIEVIRKIVVGDRGAIVSAHENVIVCAFNLLTPTGQHPMKAADCVAKLRRTLLAPLKSHAQQQPIGGANAPRPVGVSRPPANAFHCKFVCSIHSGRVHALVSPDGWTFCSGDTVTIGRMLLDKAVGLATALEAGRAMGLLRQSQREAALSQKQQEERDAKIKNNNNVAFISNNTNLNLMMMSASAPSLILAQQQGPPVSVNNTTNAALPSSNKNNTVPVQVKIVAPRLIFPLCPSSTTLELTSFGRLLLNNASIGGVPRGEFPLSTATAAVGGCDATSAQRDPFFGAQLKSHGLPLSSGSLGFGEGFFGYNNPPSSHQHSPTMLSIPTFVAHPPHQQNPLSNTLASSSEPTAVASATIRHSIDTESPTTTAAGYDTDAYTSLPPRPFLPQPISEVLDTDNSTAAETRGDPHNSGIRAFSNSTSISFPAVPSSVFGSPTRPTNISNPSNNTLPTARGNALLLAANAALNGNKKSPNASTTAMCGADGRRESTSVDAFSTTAFNEYNSDKADGGAAATGGQGRGGGTTTGFRTNSATNTVANTSSQPINDIVQRMRRDDRELRQTAGRCDDVEAIQTNTNQNNNYWSNEADEENDDEEEDTTTTRTNQKSLDGLCLLYCANDVSSSYHCEAIDVTTFRPRVRGEGGSVGISSTCTAAPFVGIRGDGSSSDKLTAGGGVGVGASRPQQQQHQWPHTHNNTTTSRSPQNRKLFNNDIILKSSSSDANNKRKATVVLEKGYNGGGGGGAGRSSSIPTNNQQHQQLPNLGGSTLMEYSLLNDSSTCTAPRLGGGGGGAAGFHRGALYNNIKNNNININNNSSANLHRINNSKNNMTRGGGVGASSSMRPSVVASISSPSITNINPTGSAPQGGANTNSNDININRNSPSGPNATNLLLARPRVLYRLGESTASADGNVADDEWMYQLKLGEDTNPYARLNAIFNKIASEDIDGAQQLLERDFPVLGAGIGLLWRWGFSSQATVAGPTGRGEGEGSHMARPSHDRSLEEYKEEQGGKADGFVNDATATVVEPFEKKHRLTDSYLHIDDGLNKEVSPTTTDAAVTTAAVEKEDKLMGGFTLCSDGDAAKDQRVRKNNSIKHLVPAAGQPTVGKGSDITTFLEYAACNHLLYQWYRANLSGKLTEHQPQHEKERGVGMFAFDNNIEDQLLLLRSKDMAEKSSGSSPLAVEGIGRLFVVWSWLSLHCGQ